MRKILLFSALAVASSPALADHSGPAGVGGGGLFVLAPDTLAKGSGAAGLRLVYVRPEQRSDAALAALAGEHVHAHNSDYNLNASAGIAYGVSDRLTLSIELPYVRRDHLREGSHAHVGGAAVNAVETLGTVAGLGDASLLARYKLIDGPVMATLIGGIKAPTGETHERSDEGERLETEHQPGTGSWDPIAGIALGARVGSARLTASALYQRSGKGAQHSRLGDRTQIGAAISHRFGGEHHDETHHHEDAEHHDDSDHEHQALEAPHGHRSLDAFVELTQEWEGRQKVAGEVESDSGGKSLWLSPGARFNGASGLSLAAGIGLPLWQRIRESHPDNKWRLTLSLGQAF